jgi:conjugative transfer signal peptidase TraF
MLLQLLWLNLSPSLPLGLYRTVHVAPVRGAIVVVCLPRQLGVFARARDYLGRGPCAGNVERLGKRVAGVAGDTIDMDAFGVSINHVRIPHSAPLARDSRGRPLPSMTGRRIVPDGHIFILANENPRSFDSRYFGPIPVCGAIVVKPILVLGAHANGVRALEHVAEPLHGQPQLEAGDDEADDDTARDGHWTAAGEDCHPDAGARRWR